MTTKKERAAALAAMTKAELLKTIKALDAKQTKLLNRIAQLEGVQASAVALSEAITPEAVIPSSANMEARFAWLEDKAANMGYALTPANAVQCQHSHEPNATTIAAMQEVVQHGGGWKTKPPDVLDRDRKAFGGFPWEKPDNA